MQKAGDLPYFLRELTGASYEHDTRLAPDAALLAEVHKHHLPFEAFEARFRALMALREVPAVLERASFERQRTALLCSEPSAALCHRGIVVGMLAEAWGAVITHV